MPIGGDSESQILKHVLSGWGTNKGLLAAVFLCFLVSLAGDSWRDRSIIFAIALILLGVPWTQARWQWWGRWHKQKIRFLVGVYCDDETIEGQIEEDFTRELRVLIKDGNLGHDVAVVQATRAECRDADGDADLRELMVRKRAHVFVYGRIKRRESSDGKSLYVHLRAAVAHAALEAKVQENFAKEITSVFPSGTLKIPVNEQLPQLKLTADWVGVSTRYIMSLAAGISGDLDYAEKMLSDASRLVPRLSTDVAKRTKINERLLTRLFELHRAQALRSFAAWRQTREVAHAQRIKAYLEKALMRAPRDSAMKQMLATTNFVLTGDAITAERELRAAMFDNPAVYASLAFALAMQGKYSEARRAYRETWKRKPAQDLIDQVQTFCTWFKYAYPQFSDQTIWCEIQVATYVKSDEEGRQRRIDYLLQKGFGDASERQALTSMRIKGDGGS